MSFLYEYQEDRPRGEAKNISFFLAVDGTWRVEIARLGKDDQEMGEYMSINIPDDVFRSMVNKMNMALEI